MTTENLPTLASAKLIDFALNTKPGVALMAMIGDVKANYKDFAVPAVADPASYAIADGKLGLIKKMQSELEVLRTEIKKPFDKVGKDIQAAVKPAAEILKRIEDELKAPMLAYRLAEEEKRAAQQAENDRQAKAKADAERATLELDAIAAELFGDDQAALALKERAATVEPERVVVAEVTNTGGSSSLRTKWEATLTDPEAFFKHLAGSKAWDYILPPDVINQHINRVARETDGQANVPGVEFKKVPLMAGRAIG